MLYTLSFVVSTAACFGLAMFLTATSLVTYRGRGVPRWISCLGFAAAAAFLISAREP
jgi:hypothetical protein